MKIAISGKGGSGKTTIAGTLARILAEDGHAVVAIDDDDNPNLALTLGVPPDQVVPPLPNGAVERVTNAEGQTELRLATSLDDLVETASVAAPGPVRLLKAGEITEAGAGCFCSAHAAVSVLLGNVEGADEKVVIADMVAGVEHLSRGTARHVDMLLVVVEPYFKSLETGRRTHELAQDLGIQDIRIVANKVRDADEHTAVEEYLQNRGLELTAVVPFDEAVMRADAEGRALIDVAPKSQVVEGIRDVARRLVKVAV